jgi:hypothetical protein
MSFSRIQSFLHKLPTLAQKSDLANSHHGAVLICNGAPMVWGFNTIKGLDTHHAEFDVMRRFLISQGMLGYVRNLSSLLRRDTQKCYEKECHQGCGKASS